MSNKKRGQLPFSVLRLSARIRITDEEDPGRTKNEFNYDGTSPSTGNPRRSLDLEFISKSGISKEIEHSLPEIEVHPVTVCTASR